MKAAIGLPAVHKGFDIEAESWTNPTYVFSVQLFEDGRLPRIVQTAVVNVNARSNTDVLTYRNRMRISFSFCLFLRMIVRRPI